VFGFEVADARLDGGATTQLVFDRRGDASLLAGDVDLELVARRRVVAAVAAVGDLMRTHIFWTWLAVWDSLLAWD
jgi:hypothetical protein